MGTTHAADAARPPHVGGDRHLLRHRGQPVLPRARRDGGLDSTTELRLDPGDVRVLGTQTIHAVTNPTGRLAGAIHVYGGDFVNQPRSQWGPGDLVERPFSMETLHEQFRDANDAAGLGRADDQTQQSAAEGWRRSHHAAGIAKSSGIHSDAMR